ncbi:hypothetical protein C6499_19280 [Candidatus Poribacteria bacterium]|nr:MAG: hypothetical protein C6499_19280 [Candidatus Poribacteria bacterium]
MRTLRVGDKYPIDPPPTEGFVARINGASFECVGFAKISHRSAKQFRRNPLRYGTYLTPTAPFFLIEIQDSEWYFNVSINISAENEQSRATFLNNENNVVNLILCDIRTGHIKAMRVVTIKAEVMKRIKETCRAQFGKSAAEVDRAITTTYQWIGLDEMLGDADMYTIRKAD